MGRLSPIAFAIAVLGLAASARAAETVWIEVKSPNFTVVSDAREGDARRAAWQFEQIRALFAQQWPWARLSSGRPFLILAARNEGSLKELLPEYWEVKGRARPAGVFFGGTDRSYAALRVDVEDASSEGEYFRNPYHVIHHEYVHLLVNLNFQEMPVWLNEGLAEYWGDTVVEAGQVSKGMPIPGHVWLLRERTLLPMKTLLEVEPGSPHYTEENKASVFYAQSWALVHYLFFGAEGEDRGALNRLAGALKNGARSSDATAEFLPGPLALDKALQSYVNHSAFRYHKIAAPLVADSMKAYTVRPLSGAAARAVRGAFFAHRGRSAEARALIDEALRLDPKLAAAHEASGVLALREDRPEDAQASFARAADLDPENFFTQYMKGHFLLGAAGGTSRLAEAEAALYRSAQLNHDFAPAYAMLATVATLRGAAADQTEPLARRAIALEPGNPVCHLSLATLLAAAGKAEAARQAAEKAVAVARTDEEREYMKRQVERLAAVGSERTATSSASGKAGVRSGPATPASLEKGCAADVVTDCLDLGLAYESGDGVPKDASRAVQLHEKACRGGASVSCDRLGSIFEFGWGVGVDLKKAAGYYEQACGGEEANGCQRLGSMREGGLGIPKDAPGAVAAYDRACRVAEEPDACALLARLLVKGTVAKDPKRALALAEKVCADRPHYCGVLGAFHQSGVAGAPNEARAAELYAKACEAGDPNSCTEAGLMRMWGTGADQAEAGRLFARSCERGDPRGCANLAALHETGSGVPRDLARAQDLYKKACAAGEMAACRKVKSASR